MSVGDAHVYTCTCTVHDKLSCTRLQNYTIGASLTEKSVSVLWNLSFTPLTHGAYLVCVAGDGKVADSDDDGDEDDDEAGAEWRCEWTRWSEWSECTVTCGRGFIMRRRTSTVDTGHETDSCTRSTVQHQQKSCRTHVLCLLRQCLTTVFFQAWAPGVILSGSGGHGPQS